MKTLPNDSVNGHKFNDENALTKREYFAAMAMKGLASDPTLTSHKTPLEVTHIATVYADALIEELNK